MTPEPTGEPQSASGRTVPPRAAFWRAWSVWVLTLAVAATALIYNQVHPLPPKLSGGTGNALAGTVAVTFLVGFATVGALLGWKRPANPIGWLLSATGLSYAVAFTGLLLLQFPRTRGWGQWLGWMCLFGIGFVVFVLLLFPTGALLSRRWRPVAWAAAAAIAAWALGNAFAPTIITAAPRRYATPSAWPGRSGTSSRSWPGRRALIVATGLAAIVSLVFRYRRAGTVEREQLKWLVYAGGADRGGGAGRDRRSRSSWARAPRLPTCRTASAAGRLPSSPWPSASPSSATTSTTSTSSSTRPSSTARWRRSSPASTWRSWSASARWPQHGTQPSLVLSIVATAVVAVAFQPVRERVQRLANRLVYGQRATPYEVLADFAERMAGTYATEDLLPRMARILAEGTGAARADVWLKSGDSSGDDAAWPPGAPPLPPTRGHRGRRAGVPGRRPDRAGALPGRGARSAVGVEAAGRVADAD